MTEQGRLRSAATAAGGLFAQLRHRLRSPDLEREAGRKSGLALVTANFGGIDTLKPFPATPGIDTFLYTDGGVLAGADPAAVSSWGRIIVSDCPRDDLGPRLRGRFIKHQIHRLPEIKPYRWVAWADGSVQFRDPSFLLRALEKLATLAPYQRLALMPHPDRHTVREEYEYVVRQIENGNEYLRLRYAPEKMTEQMNSFTDRGWNLDARLWAIGVWLIENDDLITRCWDGWWDQTRRYRMTLDQLSLPVLLGHFGLEAQAMDFNLWHNPFFDLVKHRASM